MDLGALSRAADSHPIGSAREDADPQRRGRNDGEAPREALPHGLGEASAATAFEELAPAVRQVSACARHVFVRFPLIARPMDARVHPPERGAIVCLGADGPPTTSDTMSVARACRRRYRDGRAQPTPPTRWRPPTRTPLGPSRPPTRRPAQSWGVGAGSGSHVATVARSPRRAPERKLQKLWTPLPGALHMSPSSNVGRARGAHAAMCGRYPRVGCRISGDVVAIAAVGADHARMGIPLNVGVAAAARRGARARAGR